MKYVQETLYTKIQCKYDISPIVKPLLRPKYEKCNIFVGILVGVNLNENQTLQILEVLAVQNLL